MMPTLPSTVGLSFLSSIEDNKDYPQNHIIFKNRPNSLAYNELGKQD
jgi:hypothetical protein